MTKLEGRKVGGRPPVHDWAKWDHLVGQVSDTQLAEMIGCTSTAVLVRRRKLQRDAAGPVDPLQNYLIGQMEARGMNPNQVAEALAGKISRTHVCDYLTRRASMGSHKLWHVLELLAPDLWKLIRGATQGTPPGPGVKMEGARQ